MATLEPVRLSGINHRDEEFIGIYFARSAKIDSDIRKFASCKWSRSNRCWIIPLSRDNYEKLIKALNKIAKVDDSDLRKFLYKRKQALQKSGVHPGFASMADIPAIAPIAASRTKVVFERSTGIHEVNRHILPAMLEQLKLKSYSQSTIKTYLNEMAPMLRLLDAKPADELTEDQIRKYLVYCHEKLKLSENTLHSRMNALKFYFEQVLRRDRFFWNIPRPKKYLQLPKLLNEEELSRLFNSLKNKKHKAMLFTVYSAGLRVSEVVNLKIEHIDSGRMQILVAKSKGKKDRYVNLSPVVLDILRDYIKTYTPRPRVFLFESEQTMTAYPARTVQQIFSNAKERAGIRKKVGIHSLRHSFATHLLDKGTDIRFIKDILGHFNIKTTERYLHVTKQQLGKIESPFDDLWKSGGIQW